MMNMALLLRVRIKRSRQHLAYCVRRFLVPIIRIPMLEILSIIVAVIGFKKNSENWIDLMF
jgi:hypothetical protein